MGSTRLPGKVLMNLAGRSVLWHIITRLRQAEYLDQICVATTDDHQDDCIVEACQTMNIQVYRGSTEDVLSRYYDCAKFLGMNPKSHDYIIRITADCPFVDPKIVDTLIGIAVSEKYDYVSNIDPPTFPDGLDVEVFKFDALEYAYMHARRSSEREHVTPHIRNNPLLSKYNYTSPTDLSNIRLTLDTYEDFMLISSIYKRLYQEGKIISLNDVLDVLSTHPELLDINARFQRNEGYLKSLSNDRQLNGDCPR